MIEAGFSDALVSRFSDDHFVVLTAYEGSEAVILELCERIHSFEREVCYLTVHSMLHLLGYDHMEPEEKRVMRVKEESVMTQLGLRASL
jgi:hypothetical protein